MDKNVGTIYVDCTNTVFTGLNTGIQRVVRNIIQRIRIDNYVENTRLVSVVAVMGEFYKFNADISQTFFWTNTLSNILAKGRNFLNYLFMNKHSNGDWPVDIVHSKPDASDVHGTAVHFSRKIIPRMFKLAYRADGIIVGEKIRFNKNDVLFVSDAFWKESLIKSLSNINDTDIKLIMLIYDLFPVTNPELVDSVHQKNFVQCLSKLLNKVQGVISISRSSLSDIEVYFSNTNTDVLLDYFYLGADFSVKGKISGNIRNGLKTLYESGNNYLAVGTVEPRKNYGYLLDAFHQLWEQDNDIKLCIVGRVGWLCDDLMRRIETSKEIGKRLYHFADLNDDELAFCYHNSKGVVFPSKIEGFGLPLVEAMHYGKPVFASDIPVFREIGKDYPFILIFWIINLSLL